MAKDYIPISMLRAKIGAPADHAKEIERHSADLFRPAVRVSFTEGHLFPGLGK